MEVGTNSNKLNSLAYLKMLFKDVTEYPGIGYVIRDKCETSDKFGYKALMDMNLSVIFESHPYKKCERYLKSRITDFKVTGNLLLEYTILTNEKEPFRESIQIEHIYKIEKVKTHETDTIKLVETDKILLEGLRGLNELKWGEKFIAYIASYDIDNGLYRPGLVVYDSEFNIINTSLEDLKQAVRVKRSVSREVSDRLLAHIGAGIKYNSNGPEYIFNTYFNPMIKIKASNDGSYSLIKSDCNYPEKF